VILWSLDLGRNDAVEDRYSVLVRTENEVAADGFYFKFNGKRFSPPEVSDLCSVLCEVTC